MLNRNSIFNLGWILLFVCSSIQTVHAHRRNNQGSIDLHRTMKSTCDGQTAQRLLKRYKTLFQNKINSMQKRVKKLKRSYDNARRGSRNTRHLTALSQVKSAALRLRTLYVQLRKKLAKMEEKTSQLLVHKVRSVIRLLAKKKRLMFVYEKGQRGLLYVHPSRDYTRALIRLYNKKHCVLKQGEWKPKRNNRLARKVKQIIRKERFGW